MNPTAIRSLSLIAIFAAIVGCQTAPRFAWWKQDKAAENSAVASTSKTPALPSAQSAPSAVAIAGVTPTGSPPITAVAASTPTAGATGLTSAPLSPPGAPPSVAIPLAAAASPLSASPPPTENGLADKLVSTPNSKLSPTSPLGATKSAAQAPAASTVAAAGPYDPNAYKPTPPMGSSDTLASSVDRYGAVAST